MSASRSLKQAVAQATGVAVSKQIRYNTDGIQESSNMLSSIPKVWEVLPLTAPADEPWNGTEGYVEFELPEHLGKLTDMIVQFEVKRKRVGSPAAAIVVSATGSTGPTATGPTATSPTASSTVKFTPTTFWFKSVALLYNGQEIERVDSDDIHNETINYCTDQQFNTIRSLCNVSATGGLEAGSAQGTEYGASQKFYLPLWANFASTAQLFPAGFGSGWRFRCTFAPNVYAGGSTGVTGGNLQLAGDKLKLFVVEQQLDDGVFNSLKSAHQSGIVYRSVLRNKFTKTESNIPTSADYSAVLTTFTTDTAALVLYVKPVDAAGATALNRHSLNWVGLRNKNNAEITINIPSDLLEGFIMPQQIPLASILADSRSATLNNHYLLCFASNLLSVLETGAMLGGYKMDGGSRVVFRPDVALSDVTVAVLSYDYAKMSVRGGVPTIERKA